MDSNESIDPDFVPDDTDSSDTEYSTGESDSEEELDPIKFGDWTVLCDAFSDQRPLPLKECETDYDFHPALDFEELHSAKNCFQSFMDKTVVESVCRWTNERAAQFFTTRNPEDTQKIVNGLKWRDVLVPEMFVFFGLLLLTGLVKCSNLADYWSSHLLTGGPAVFCAKVMDKNRFLSILKFLRFSKSSAAKSGSPLTRVGMFIAQLRENCMLLVDPGVTFAIDECLMLYKGQLHFKQYIKTKRSRFGIKLFCLSPSAKNLRGYTYNFAIYTGKDLYDVSHIQGTDHLSLSERIPVYLAQNLLGQGREIVLDNWYMSTNLASFLLTKDTYVTGTMQPRWGIPKHMTTLPLGPHQACYIRNGETLAARFRDKRDVYILSTKCTAGFVDKSRYLKGGKHIFYKKPSVIEHYNQNMGAVDTIDQELEPHDCSRKNYTWFKKLGIHLIQRMVLNAKVLYNEANKTSIPQYDFLKTVVHEILLEYSTGYQEMINQKRVPAPSMLHVMTEFPKEAGSRRPRKRCRVCFNEGVNKLSTKGCMECEGMPGLCSSDHFLKYHGK